MSSSSIGCFLGRIAVCAVCVALPATPAAASAPAGHFAATSGGVHDTKTNLTWQEPAPPGAFSWAMAKTYCPTLGSGWRLPTVKELLTIVDDSRSDPSIDPTAFSALSASTSLAFWSSSPVALPPDMPPNGPPIHAWIVHFGQGTTLSTDPLELDRVRCVR